MTSLEKEKKMVSSTVLKRIYNFTIFEENEILSWPLHRHCCCCRRHLLSKPLTFFFKTLL